MATTTAETFANQPTTTVTSGGTTAPVPGTTESWTVASSASFPSASNAASPPTQFHVADTVTGKTSEIIAVTNVSGTTWAVTRGAESTTPVAHAPGFAIVQVVSAGALACMLQAPNNLSEVTSAATARSNLGLSGAATAPLPLSIPNGGTGQATQQTALDALAGAATSGSYLRGNGSHVAMSAVQLADLPSNGGVPLTYMPAAVITTTGSTFSPWITLTAGSAATVSWVYNGAVVATGLTPVISFGSAATRTVRMYATDANGFSALSQIQVFNIGFNHSLDTGPWSPSAASNWPAQQVSGLAGVNAMTGLQWLLAESITSLTGTLDLTGMSWLTVADLYGSSIQSVNLAGCSSLLRLSLEINNLTSLDLNPVAASLRDLRSALQQGGTLTLATLSAPLSGIWHFCVRSELVYNMPDTSIMMPNLAQLLSWSAGHQGALKTTSGQLNSVELDSNYYVSADFTNEFLPFAGGASDLILSNNQLTSVNLTGCVGLSVIDLHQNPMTQATVDGILATADSWGTSGGTLNLGNTAAPSSTGTTHKNNLAGRGWTVTVDASGAPGGGFGAKFTYGESAVTRVSSATFPLEVTLATPVASGDLLVAMVEGPVTPKFWDSSGNTWTVTGPYNSSSYLAYCLSPAASAGGLTVAVYGGSMYGLCVSRFKPAGTVSFGGVASSVPDIGGINFNSSQNMGNLGTVPANALLWGAVTNQDPTIRTFSGGFQSGTGGTPGFVGSAASGVGGSACIAYVPGCANANASLTWFGSSHATSSLAVSAYFTST